MLFFNKGTLLQKNQLSDNKRGEKRKLRNDENSGLQLEYGMKERFKYLIRNLFLKL